MIVPILLFTSSWVASTVIGRTAAKDAIANIGSNPYIVAGQRTITPVERIATAALLRRESEQGTNEPEPDYSTYPLWLRITGVAVDVAFAFSVVSFLLQLPWGNPQTLVQLVCAYFAAGVVYFLYAVFVVGRIGQIGYHFLFLSVVSMWPRFWNKFSPAPRNG